MCGVVGIVGDNEVISDLHAAAYKHQHRAHRCAGMVSYDSSRSLYHTEKGIGRFTEIFTKEKLGRLKGKIAIAHLRWATKGDLKLENAHPLSGVFNGKPVFVVHNGEISFRKNLSEQFKNYQPDVTADTKFILALIESYWGGDFTSALFNAFNIIKGTYSLIFLYDNSLYVVRDVTGIRPLFVGRREGAVCVVSESSAFNILNIPLENTREVEAGEMLIIRGDDLSIESMTIIGPPDIPRQVKLCFIELMYSMYPTTVVYGRTVMNVRAKLGYTLAKKNSFDADVVVGVPDSGLDAARGFAEGAGIPIKMGLLRYHQSGRIFYYAVEEREDKYVFKYDPVREVLRDKRIVIIDDTMFASSTIRNVGNICIASGARELNIGIPSPMIVLPCYYGTPTSSDHRNLIARDHGGIVESIKNDLNKNFGGRLKSLAFLDLKDAKQALVDTTPTLPGYDRITADNLCDACFLGGSRHIPVDTD